MYMSGDLDSGILDCKTARIFAYLSTREQSNKRSRTRLKTESETGERRFFFSLASHALRACEASALRACKTLTPRFTDFFTDFEEKTGCFAVYWNPGPQIFACRIRGFGILNPSHGIQNPTHNWHLDSKIHCQ